MSQAWNAEPVGSAPLILGDETRERVRAHLWSVGITEDPFAMDPKARLAWLQESRDRALVVYAAIKHECPEMVLESFREWSTRLGLSW